MFGEILMHILSPLSVQLSHQTTQAFEGKKTECSVKKHEKGGKKEKITLRFVSPKKGKEKVSE